MRIDERDRYYIPIFTPNNNIVKLEQLNESTHNTTHHAVHVSRQ